MIHATRTDTQPAHRTGQRDPNGTPPSDAATLVSFVRETNGRERDRIRPRHRTEAGRTSDRPAGIVEGRRR